MNKMCHLFSLWEDELWVELVIMGMKVAHFEKVER
jgi:hypothetical protein